MVDFSARRPAARNGAILPETTANSKMFYNKVELNKFSRIQNPVRVERRFNDEMELAGFRGNRLRPPAFLRQADAVFARDAAALGDHPAE